MQPLPAENLNASYCGCHPRNNAFSFFAGPNISKAHNYSLVNMTYLNERSRLHPCRNTRIKASLKAQPLRDHITKDSVYTISITTASHCCTVCGTSKFGVCNRAAQITTLMVLALSSSSPCLQPLYCQPAWC